MLVWFRAYFPGAATDSHRPFADSLHPLHHALHQGMSRLPSCPVEWDAKGVAENLRQVEDGFWCARETEWISYGEQSNANCFQIEEQSFWFRHRNACLLTVLQRLPPSGRIFDIGGGNGFVSRALESAGFPTVLVEPGPTGVRNARVRGLPSVVCGTLASAGFRAACMDAAGLFDVLEHIQDRISSSGNCTAASSREGASI